MSALTAERLAQLHANYSWEVKMPEFPEYNKGNLGPFGLSSPSPSIDGRGAIECDDSATACPEAACGVQVTPTRLPESQKGHPENQGTREKEIETFHRALHKKPNYGCASPYFSFEKPIEIENLKRSIDDSSSPEAKRRKTVPEKKSEEDDGKAGIHADVLASVNSEAAPLGGTLSTTPQYAIAREVRKQSMQPQNNRALPTKSELKRPWQLHQPKTNPVFYSRYDTWLPDYIENTRKMYYKPRTAEEEVAAWFEADRKRLELQELQMKELGGQMSWEQRSAGWRKLRPSEVELHDTAPQDDEVDTVSETSSPASSIMSMSSSRRSSTTTVSSDGGSPDRKKRKVSIGEAAVPTVSSRENALHESPPTAPEIPRQRYTEKEKEEPATKRTQDASQELAPAQVPQTEAIDSRPIGGSEINELSNLTTQEHLVCLGTQKDSVLGTSSTDADSVDGLQDGPKNLQFSQISIISEVPPADTQSDVALEEQAKEAFRKQRKQKTPKSPPQGRKNQKKALSPIPSKIEKPSARMTRSRSKTNHSTKFQKLDSAGKLPVAWTALTA